VPGTRERESPIQNGMREREKRTVQRERAARSMNAKPGSVGPESASPAPIVRTYSSVRACPASTRWLPVSSVAASVRS